MGYIADHAHENAKLQFRLVELDFATVLRLTDCSIGIEWGTYSWVAAGIAVSSIVNSIQGPTCSITVPDADHTLFALLDASNGGEGVVVRIYLAEFSLTNATATPDDVVQLYAGRIQSARKNTTTGLDQVEIACGPPAQVSAIDFPSRLLISLLRTT